MNHLEIRTKARAHAMRMNADFPTVVSIIDRLSSRKEDDLSLEAIMHNIRTLNDITEKWERYCLDIDYDIQTYLRNEVIVDEDNK